MTVIKFAYTSWWNDGVQCSGLYRGKRAQRFVDDFRKGNSFASIHYGGDDVVDKYIDTVNTWLSPSHSPLTRASLLRPVVAKAGKKGF